MRRFVEAEYVYVDLDMLPGTKVYKLPDDMSLRLGALAEPLTSCIRALNRAKERPAAGNWGKKDNNAGIWPDRHSRHRGGAGNGCRPRHLRRRAGTSAASTLARRFGAETTMPTLKTLNHARRRIARAARDRRRLRRRSRHGLLRPSLRRARGHRDAARRRHLCRDGAVHRRRKNRNLMAWHLHQRS